MIANAKNGVSSYEIHRAIGVTQKTAWSMLHRIRLAIQSETFDQMRGQAEVLKIAFERLTEDWQRDTRHLSFDRQIAMHPSYQAIIGMGPAVLPLIFDALQNELDHWFYALAVITRENPVPQNEAGHMEQMRERWLAWGRRRGYIQQNAA
jgi:hypothetical protein